MSPHLSELYLWDLKQPQHAMFAAVIIPSLILIRIVKESIIYIVVSVKFHMLHIMVLKNGSLERDYNVLV